MVDLNRRFLYNFCTICIFQIRNLCGISCPSFVSKWTKWLHNLIFWATWLRKITKAISSSTKIVVSTLEIFLTYKISNFLRVAKRSNKFSNQILVAKRSNRWQKDPMPGKKIQGKKIQPPCKHNILLQQITIVSYFL